ncbi:MAG: hypothetical protein JNL57_10840 [Bacteroidetes bacterium]|nr:hypothetical protein [Bacteroidota bacterium]
MKTNAIIILMILPYIPTRAQTLWNFKVVDMMMLQRLTPCYGLQVENKSLRLEFSTPYSLKTDQNRFMEATARPDKPVRFVHGRFGITAMQTNPVTKKRDLSGYYKDKYLGNGWWTLKWETIHTIFDDNLIFEPGIDYYQYFATTKGDAMIYGTNGQSVGRVVGSNMRVYSGYVRLSLQRSYEIGVARLFAEYLRAFNMTFDDVNYGLLTTGLKPGGNSGFDVKKWGWRLGLELYAKKMISTRFVLGTAPGIKGRNAFATYVNLGFPLVLGSK